MMVQFKNNLRHKLKIRSERKFKVIQSSKSKKGSICEKKLESFCCKL